MMFVLAVVLAAAAVAGGEQTAIEAQLAAGNFPSALKRLEGVPSQDRGAAWHLLASKVYDGLNDPARAVREAQTAIDLNPRSEPSRLQLAQVFLSRNTPTPAYEILTDALTVFPSSSMIRLGLGLALKELQRYDDAARVLTECLRLNPDLGAAFDALGTVYLDSHDYNQLLNVSTDYVRRHPVDFRGYYYQAAAQEKLRHDAAETESIVRRSIHYNPRFAASQALLGRVLMGEGQLQPAISALEEAIRLRPDFTPAHYYLANAYKQSGRYDEAKREFAEVSRLKQVESRPVPTLRYHQGDSQKASPPHQ